MVGLTFIDNMFTLVGGLVGGIGLPYLVLFRNTTKAERAAYSMPELFSCFLLFGFGAGLGGCARTILGILFYQLGIKL